MAELCRALQWLKLWGIVRLEEGVPALLNVSIRAHVCDEGAVELASARRTNPVPSVALLAADQ